MTDQRGRALREIREAIHQPIAEFVFVWSRRSLSFPDYNAFIEVPCPPASPSVHVSLQPSF